ncbi:spore photoproduct lyase [Thermosyntropha lipolytica DSM 11003]|uniref:Spore photoproduct lyase n=1 Tax=Thermosyntropha lipolytica DSM 11003 TaxID=1123382 RepID=A0A1M5RH62_9FIRM|nr:spore photoproduct lyase [Thermosyntropha lipolytica]SHH25635.1 spore photoproduct lyase [Thermosyntropha lipolytica DSM 11003]
MLTKLKFKRVFFEKEALDYPLGKKIYQNLRQEGFNIHFLKSHNRVTGIPGQNPREAFFQAKSTLVVGIRKNLQFETCKPSAHYQLPLVTGCEGICEYCYLNTQLGKKPYIRIYVNVDQILGEAKKYIEKRKPEITIFEAAATSDPVAVEPYSGALSQAISFFAKEEFGRLRFVTKFPYVDSFLSLEHNKHTRIRFSLNTERIIKTYEHRTPDLQERLDGLKKIAEHGYPSGVIIAPVILDAGWKTEYEDLLQKMHAYLKDINMDDFHLEIISHRFTTRAKNNILQVFPQTLLPMDEKTDRKFKYGQFGYGKFVYTEDKLIQMKEFFKEKISQLFPEAVIDYII